MTDRREHLAHGVLGLLAERSGLDDPVHYCDRVTREERLRAAIETTLGRTLAAAVSDVEQVMFEALSASLTWVCALDESFEENRNGYKSRRNTDGEGCYLRGLRYARNQVVHGHTVLDVAQSAVVPNPVVMRSGSDANSVSRVLTPRRLDLQAHSAAFAEARSEIGGRIRCVRRRPRRDHCYPGGG